MGEIRDIVLKLDPKEIESKEGQFDDKKLQIIKDYMPTCKVPVKEKKIPMTERLVLMKRPYGI